MGALQHPYPRAFLYASQLRSHQETKMAPVELNDRHLRSRGKIREFTQLTEWALVIKFQDCTSNKQKCITTVTAQPVLRNPLTSRYGTRSLLVIMQTISHK